MKRLTFVLIGILTVFATLAMAFTPAAAEGSRSIKLIGVSHWHGKGLVLHFSVEGYYNPKELDGVVHIGDHEFSMDCNFGDDGALNCVVGDAIAQYIGKDGYAVIGGVRFYFTVPIKRDLSHCYDVWSALIDNYDALNQASQSTNGIDILTFVANTHPAIVDQYCLGAGETVPPEMIEFIHPQQSEYEQLFGLNPGELTSLLPAIFVDENTLPPEFIGCLPSPAYHDEFSMLGHLYKCNGLPQ